MNKPKNKRKPWVFLGVAASIGFSLYLGFKLSPWPSAMLIRLLFDYGGNYANSALEAHVPSGIEKVENIIYDVENKATVLDIYYSPLWIKQKKKLPLLVWVHGGAWVSGDKSHVANYSKIMASKGYIVASVNYSLSPESQYPLPVLQINQALSFLTRHAAAYSIDSNLIFMAGDSAGSHIVAQVANSISDHEYANLINLKPAIERRQLKGLVLHCGAYNAKILDMKGDFKYFLKTVLWSYSGQQDFQSHSEFKTASVVHYLTDKFPPSFISAGNDDPLLVQSQQLAHQLNLKKVEVDTLFFPKNYEPKLPHEYQFNLDTEAGQLALERSLAFMKKQL